VSARSVLAAAETKLRKAKRTYAKTLLGLVVDHLRHHHPQAVRLTLYADQHTHQYFIGELLDPDGQVIGLDPDSVVVPREQIHTPSGERVIVGPYGIAELLHRALATYDGPLEKLLRTDRYTREHYLDLTRAP
jgi:hypothetical protein